jgi:hypothetical protein
MTRCACLSVVACLLLAPPYGLAAPGKGDIKDGKKEEVKKGEPKKEEVKKPEKLTQKDLEGLWETLVGNDAAKAYRAIWSMVADPDRSVPFLRERLKPVPPPAKGRVEKLLSELDSGVFKVREKAMAELEKMGALAKDAIKKALDGKPSLEVRRRLEKLMDKLSSFTLSGEELRTWRALEVLELVGNPTARQVLQALGKGAPGVWQTEEARAALDRLAKRVAAAP